MLHKFKKIDPLIVTLLIVLIVIGAILQYSVGVGNTTFAFDVKKSIVIYLISILAFVGAAYFDYRILTKVSYYLYGFGVLLLVAVYFFGSNINNARGWFQFGFLSFQPVELMKIILIITLAAFMARRKGEPLELIRDVLPIGMLVAIPIGLVLLQPDFGNGLILAVLLVGMLWIGNIKGRFVLIGVTIIGGFTYLLLFLVNQYYAFIISFLSERKLSIQWIVRINTFINPTTADKNDSYHVDSAIRSIGSGFLTGEGYLQGTSPRTVPYAYSDSIFAVVGEEFGFVGASILLLIYFVLIYRMILIALYCNNYAGSFIIIGIVTMLVFQIFQNVGMMIGIMPLTGITLPFVSYGGTSLLINMVSMGLVMSIKMHDDRLLDED
ncbi:FtsW/RodA/SpoVE family cell cycle protein [Paenibacillus puerhi]|uniref:FtsW/RodA/SpoVE family cell cycle protein n=1 Tax=Paenibacillus puerhi TaxID=2692622 RepID=UPI00135B61A0|nr:FtsW/RodA/SpoVE family cell cycle protein [Paenibacillus puerhi]